MSLEEALARVLPSEESYDVFQWQSTSRDTHPLITHRKHNENIKTIKCEHFITLAHEEHIFFGVEIFVYVVIDYENDTTEKLLFVSKADTTGHNKSKAKIGLVTREIIRYLLQVPVDHYLKTVIPKEATQPKYDKTAISKFTSTKEALNILIQRHTGKLLKPAEVMPYSVTNYPKPVNTKIALFTRSEPQYLFPNSSKVKTKHVLSGDGLLKWWLKCLDPVVEDIYDKYTAFLKIPAEEDKVVERYFSSLKSKWQIGDMYTSGAESDIAVFKVPLFPDDPKARFLEHLVVDNRATLVTVKQFWEELQMRQEFRLGVVVSVIGVEGVLKPDKVVAFKSLSFPRKKFKQLKNYITGEDYAEEDGGIEAYKNVVNYLESVVGTGPLPVIGQYRQPVHTMATFDNKRTSVNNLSMLVRKKQKK